MSLIKIFFINVCILLSSCNFNKRNKIDSNVEKVKIICFSNIEKQELLFSILKNSEVNQYLHLELNDRRPIYLNRNKFNNSLNGLKYNDVDIKLVDSLSSISHKIYILFNDINCQEKKASFVFRSPIEGVLIEGEIYYNYKEEKWNIN